MARFAEVRRQIRSLEVGNMPGTIPADVQQALTNIGEAIEELINELDAELDKLESRR